MKNRYFIIDNLQAVATMVTSVTAVKYEYGTDDPGIRFFKRTGRYSEYYREHPIVVVNLSDADLLVLELMAVPAIEVVRLSAHRYCTLNYTQLVKFNMMLRQLYRSI